MELYLSCPQESQNIIFRKRFLSTWAAMVVNSAPMVTSWSVEKEFEPILLMMQDLPTPELPIRISLKVASKPLDEVDGVPYCVLNSNREGS